MSDYTVQTFERETAASLVFGTDASTTTGVSVSATSDGHTMRFDKVDGDAWRLNAHYRGSLPIFENGRGSMLGRVVVDADLVDKLDDLVSISIGGAS